jgi:photosystem II stability/assembly factor-like uncharacterized protein
MSALRCSSTSVRSRGRDGAFAAPARLLAAAGLAVSLLCAGLLATLVFAAPAWAGWGLSNLCFVDESYGWAVGLQDDPAMYAVLQTTDGGATWTAQKSTGAFNGTGLDVGFTSRTRGVWVNSYLYSTVDGGAAWKQRKVPGRWGGGSFVDYATPSVVWVAGAYGSDGTGRCVARSTDGGRTWRLCLSQSTAPGRMPTSLSAPGGTVAYIWSGGLMTTRDAGRTWRTVNTHHSFKLTASWMLDFPTAKAGWMLRYDSAQLFRTVDGGSHWTQQMAKLQQRFFGMDFVNAKAGWVIGAAGSVYQTVDGGLDWTYHKVATTENLTAIDFIDRDHGWVAADAGLGKENPVFQTSDGGATWRRVR